MERIFAIVKNITTAEKSSINPGLAPKISILQTMQNIIRFLLLILAIALAVADAHSHRHFDAEGEERGEEETCTCEQGAKPFESYHIHVVFYPDGANDSFTDNSHNSIFARSLRKKFIEHFNVVPCHENGLFDQTELCAFPVDETGAGDHAPFVAPNFAFYVPVNRYADAVPWMMANRGDLDFVVHPNTCGFQCSAQDHLLWSVWGGNKWPLRFQLPTGDGDALRDQEALAEEEEDKNRVRRRLVGHTENRDHTLKNT